MTDHPDHDYHARVDPHGGGSSLGEIILGGQDGLVNVLGVILGVAAASASTRIVLAAGLAAAFAESVSMAAVAYTSGRAAGERYESERERERRHVERVPELERDEVRELYRKKGLDSDLLERVVTAITKDPEVWVAVMLAEEHGLAPVPRRQALRSALVVGVSAFVGSVLPLLPFLVLPTPLSAYASIALAATVLFVFGAYKARVTVGHPVVAGLELAGIGVVSALVGWGVGLLFQ